MYTNTLLTKLIHDPDPAQPIVEYLVNHLEPLIELENLALSYEKVEDQFLSFEKWLHEAWGTGFYQNLTDKEHGWALNLAFKIAAEKNTNLLICDGFSLRELLVLKNKFGEGLSYNVARAPAPTTTQYVSKKIFGLPNLKEAITGDKLIEGKIWKGEVVEDITLPPRIGNQRGLVFLTQYPDTPLHGARSHRTTQVQDVSNILNQILRLIEVLAQNIPLTVTGDHGYIYLGTNPQRFLWIPSKRQERFDGEYGENKLKIEGKNVAVGRYHSNVGPGSNTFITHGGVSLTESLVPIVTIEKGEKS